MADIKLKLDVIEGTLEVECNGDDFEAVMSHAEKMLEKFTDTKVQTRPAKKKTYEDLEGTSGAQNNPVEQNQDTPKSKRKRGSGKSANWKILDNLLDAGQRQQLQQFYAEKSPGKQNDQVAVLAYKLKEMLGREGFDGNEIHTAFQVVGKKTPANLTGVFGNMTGEGLGKIDDKKWTPNFKSDDLVKHDLPVAGNPK